MVVVGGRQMITDVGGMLISVDEALMIIIVVSLVAGGENLVADGAPVKNINVLGAVGGLVAAEGLMRSENLAALLALVIRRRRSSSSSSLDLMNIIRSTAGVGELEKELEGENFVGCQIRAWRDYLYL